MAIRKQVAERLSSFQTVVVWGGGGLGNMALRLWLPLEKITYIVDGNPVRHGTVMAGKNVKPIEVIAETPPDCIVICSGAHLEIRGQLRELGFEGKVLFVYETFVPDRELSELEMLAVDIAAIRNDNWLRFLLMKPQIMVNVTFRLTRWASHRTWLLPLYYVMFFLHAIICVIFGIQLPPKTKVGPGLMFAHFGTIVFTARAQIGSFFLIYHGCTVGTNDSGEGPVIGDFVSQYAGSHVLGSCRIGDHTRIGANAVALDLTSEGYCSVAGLPAKVVRDHSSSSGKT